MGISFDDAGGHGGEVEDDDDCGGAVCSGGAEGVLCVVERGEGEVGLGGYLGLEGGGEIDLVEGLSADVVDVFKFIVIDEGERAEGTVETPLYGASSSGYGEDGVKIVGGEDVLAVVVLGGGITVTAEKIYMATLVPVSNTLIALRDSDNRDRGLSSQIPTAQVDTIRLQALEDGDAFAALSLYHACCSLGFFYLDLSTINFEVSRAVSDIYHLEEKLFDLPEEELIKFDIDVLSPTKKLNGYKPVGRNLGELIGRRDGFQSYALPKDGILHLGTECDFSRPQLIDEYLQSFQTFALTVAKAAPMILSSLSRSLDLTSSPNLQSIHNTNLPSPDLIRLLKYRSQPSSEHGSSQIPHTDLGSLTFLFTRQPGLQIRNPKTGGWEWVSPPSNNTTAVVNIGDCMSMLTGGLFRSSKHRVIGIPGEGMQERYSFAYFLRPDENAILTPVRSPSISTKAELGPGREDEAAFTCRDWLQKKFKALRRDTSDQEDEWILTGSRDVHTFGSVDIGDLTVSTLDVSVENHLCPQVGNQ
ncbi:MAG: hypothetical protein Q9226_005651 [Calogaya cf. arnoldii]